MDKKPGKKRFVPQTFIPPAIICGLIVVLGVAIPKQFGAAMDVALGWVTTHFGWFYGLGTTLLVVFCIWICFSKYGKIRFGGKHAKPEMSFAKWFALVLTSGMGSGICYWCVAEPLSFFQSPPAFSGMEGGSAAAAEESLRYVLLHWTLHPYAVYTAVGLGIGFLFWNCKKPFSVATGFYPLIGEKSTGKFRYWINAICIVCLVGGCGTTVGLVIDQMVGAGFYIADLKISGDLIALIVCLGFAAIAIIAACTGLHKGIQFISSANMYIFIILMVFALCTGGTLFILNNTLTGVGKFIQNLPSQSLYMEPAYQSGWVNGWTIFYWAWWLAFAPLIGLFQVKCAKGRTVRQYVLVNMLAPCIFLIFWMGIFGSSTIQMELAGNHSISEAIAQYGSSVAFFAYLKNLPLTPILLVLAIAAVIFSVVTMIESQVLTIADLCVSEKDEEAVSDKHAPAPLKIFWGLLMSLLAYACWRSGGLMAIQTASIIFGLPVLVMMCFLCVGTVKGLKNYKKYDTTLKPGEDYDDKEEEEEEPVLNAQA
ncbi:MULTISPECIES: BCCT family transporter [Clostridia]|uniref:BCCT family transporter n=1 Tax=Clostridia TaxID=186801 RepID=UPI00067E7715|nr:MULTISPECIES: BCCT family transporter [Clostridia]